MDKYFKARYKQFNTTLILIGFVAVFSVIVIGLQIYDKHRFIENQNKGIWVIDKISGEAFKLKKEEYTFNHRLSEYKALTRDFVKHFYGFDEYNFLDNMEYCSYLMSNQVYQIELDKYRKDNVYEKLREQNITARAKIIEIDINNVGDKIKGQYTIEQILVSGTNVKKRVISADIVIGNIASRSYNNTYAAKITGHNIIKKDIDEKGK